MTVICALPSRPDALISSIAMAMALSACCASISIGPLRGKATPTTMSSVSGAELQAAAMHSVKRRTLTFIVLAITKAIVGA